MDHFNKNVAFSEGNKLFAGDFRANLDERSDYLVQFTKRWNWKWIVQHQGYFCRKFAATNVSSASNCMHLQGWSLKSSSYDSWAKYKEKVPDVSDPNQNVETTYNSKLKFA